MAHAYFITGDLEEGIRGVHAFVLEEFGLEPENNPNLITLRHGLFSVDDARKVRGLADFAATEGSQKVIIISAARIFHEAQNALLKLFEEPPEGTVLFLVIPSEGMLLPTLRSRLLPLPNRHDTKDEHHSKKNPSKSVAMLAGTAAAREFLAAKENEREKIVGKILDRAKSDNDEEKQAARLAAIQLVEGITSFVYLEWTKLDESKLKESKLLQKMKYEQTLSDLQAFLPILHERSAPLKLIFEHILLTIPASVSLREGIFAECA